MKRVFLGRSNKDISSYMREIYFSYGDANLLYSVPRINVADEVPQHTNLLEQDFNSFDAVFVVFIESGMHPVDQMKFVKELIKKAEESNTDLYCSTQSVYVVDCFEAEDVVLFNEGRQKMLSDHKDYEKCRGVLTSGELWSCYGEDWV